MPRLERGGQRVFESLIRFSRPQSLALHVIPQHQLLGVRMQIHLLVYPTLRWAQAPSRGLGSGLGAA
jgi:hypothetical protein